MSKEDKIFNAKLAEQAERYEDMVNYMKEVAAVYSFASFCRVEETLQTMTETC